MIQIVSMCGALLVLLAFALQQWGRWQATERRYLWVNIIGAGLLAAVAAIERQWGFLLLEGTWSLVSAVALLRRPSLPQG